MPLSDSSTRRSASALHRRHLTRAQRRCVLHDVIDLASEGVCRTPGESAISASDPFAEGARRGVLAAHDAGQIRRFACEVLYSSSVRVHVER